MIKVRSGVNAPSLSRKSVLIALAALAAAYLAVFAYLGTRNTISTTAHVLKKEKQFVFPLSKYLMNSFVRQGTVFFIFETGIETFEVSIPRAGYAGELAGRRAAGPAGQQPEKPAGVPSSRENILPVSRSDGGDKFRLSAREDMMDWVVRCTPRSAMPSLDVRIVLAPRLSVGLLLFQALLAFCFLAGIFSLGVLAAGIFSGRTDWIDTGIRDFMRAFLAVCVILCAYIAGRPAVFFSVFERMSVSLPKALVMNLALALPLAGLYLLFKKTRIPLVYLPLILSLFISAVWLDYRYALCGDAEQWINLVSSDNRTLYFAEILSFASAKSIYHILNRFIPGLSPSTVLTLQGKAIGVLFLFAVYALTRTIDHVTRERRILFLLLVSGLTVNVFFLGYPEFAYFPLPFLVISALFSLRYLGHGAGMTGLLSAAAFLALAGLLHGTAFFCLPAVLALPFLKYGEVPWRKKGRPVLAGCLGALLAVLLIVFLVVELSSLLGFKVSFQNVGGGGDNDRLVEFLPPGSAGAGGSVFLDILYLGMRGWAVAAGFPVLLILMALKTSRWKALSNLDRVLFMMGACQAVFLFAWNFDLGYKDFDLYIAPLTLLALLLVKKSLESLDLESGTLKGLAAVFLFALLGHVGTVLLMTGAPGF